LLTAAASCARRVDLGTVIHIGAAGLSANTAHDFHEIVFDALGKGD
jgi:hypothetical protein